MRDATMPGWSITPVLPLLAAALIGFGGPVGAVVGQQGGQEDPAEPAGEQWLRVFDLDFEGGTAAEFIEAVRQARGGANFLLSPGLEKVEVPPVKLVDVTLETVMELFEEFDDDRPRDALRLAANRIGEGGAGEPVYEVRAFRWPTSSPSMKSAVRSVNELIDSKWSTDDVLAALQTAMAVEPGDAEIKFHEATGLVILRGSKAQLEIADEALAELRHTSRDRADDLDRLHSRIEETRLALAQAQGEVELDRSELRLAEKNLQLAEKAMKSSDEPEAYALNVANTEHMVEERRVELRIQMQELEMLSSRLERLEAKLRATQGDQ